MNLHSPVDVPAEDAMNSWGVAGQYPMEGEALLAVVLSDGVPVPDELRARFRRRRAQVLAQQGKIAAAQDEFEDLTDCGHPDVEARAVIDVSLLKAGLTSAAQIRLPAAWLRRNQSHSVS